MESLDYFSRRVFLKAFGALAGAAALGGASRAGARAAPESDGRAPRRRLGKTDLRLSAISIGTGPGQEPNVLRFAMAQGVNFIHTSVGYKGGQAIRRVAEAVADRRGDVVLGLKITWSPDDDAAMDRALELLGVDSVDIAFFNIHDADTVQNPAYRKGAERWIKQGKFRYIGLTTHNDVEGCLSAALDQGFYHALMPAFNLSRREAFRPLFERAEGAGTGIILMKTRRALGGVEYADSIPEYLSLPGVATVSKGMNSFREIRELVDASARAPSAATARRLRETAPLAAAGHCAMCGACARACPAGLPVGDIVRCSDYYLEHPDTFETARETYGALARRPDLAACAACGRCEAVCASGVPVRHHLRRAETVLAG
jgi:predicted aldo/keto reductase-like oxidoreductase